ncbi:unnamed protein product [Ixodes persulcatus]
MLLTLNQMSSYKPSIFSHSTKNGSVTATGSPSLDSNGLCSSSVTTLEPVAWPAGPIGDVAPYTGCPCCVQQAIGGRVG